MADVAIDITNRRDLKELWHDNGDGTYSATSYSTGGLAAGGVTEDFADANATVSTAVTDEQRVFSETGVLNAGDNQVNRVRCAKDMIVGVGGGAMLGIGMGALQGSSFKPPLLDSKQDLQVAAGGYTTILTSTLTRPADTSAYATGDEMSSSTSAPAVNTITNAARASGGSGIIQGVFVSQNTLWTTRPVLELWIFDTTTTPSNDNSAFAPADADVDTCIGIIPLGSSYPGTINQGLDSGIVSIPFKCVGSANLFFRVVVRNAAQDSANSGVSKFRWRVLQD